MHRRRLDGVHLRLKRPQKNNRVEINFWVKNNKISQNVKGLFLGVRFVWLQLEDELLVQEGCSVRGVCSMSWAIRGKSCLSWLIGLVWKVVLEYEHCRPMRPMFGNYIATLFRVSQELRKT